jgi:uncharacterized protein YndB with AHSA1/START domain
MPTSELTKIEKKVLIRAPRSRVWRALTTPSQFAEWFSAEVQGSFVPGERVNMTSTHPLCTGDPHFYLIVERMEPESFFSWRWHPGAANTAEDGSTLVEFRLAEVEGGTLLTLTESGFDHILLSRRAKAFEQNEHGWDVQLESVTRYAEKAA